MKTLIILAIICIVPILIYCILLLLNIKRNSKKTFETAVEASKLNLDFNCDLIFCKPYKALIRKCCEAILDAEGFSSGADVSVLLTDSKEIQKMNKKFRGKDKTTDVLSFPMDEINPENGYVMLGDIVINAELAKKQAEQFGHSEEREIAFLAVHSMLHLLGYEHEDDSEGEKIMREKQREILESLGLGAEND